MKQTSDKLDSFLHGKLADLQVGEEGDAGWDQVYKKLEASGAYRPKSRKWLWSTSAVLILLIAAAFLWMYLPPEETSSTTTLAGQSDTRTETQATAATANAGASAAELNSNAAAGNMADQNLQAAAASGSSAASGNSNINASGNSAGRNISAGNTGRYAAGSRAYLGNLGSTNSQFRRNAVNRLLNPGLYSGETGNDPQGPIEGPAGAASSTGSTSPAAGDSARTQPGSELMVSNKDSAGAKTDIIIDPKAGKKRNPNWHLFAGIQYEMAFFLSSPAVGDVNPKYVHEDFSSRSKAAARHSGGASYGINLTYQHKSGFRFISGIGVTRKTQSFAYDFYNNKVPVLDPNDVILAYLEPQNAQPPASGSSNHVYFNSRQVFDYYNVPVGIGYTFKLKKLMLGLEGGMDLMFLKDFQGTELDPVSFRSRSFSNTTPVRNFNYGVWLSPQAAFSLKERFVLTVQPRYAYSFQSVFEDKHPYQVKPSSIGLQFGLKYQLF